jgi:hypothetical protein
VSGPGAEELAESIAGPRRRVGIEEWAWTVGGFVYVELALFRLVGRAATSGEPAGTAAWASGVSMRAAWRAEQLLHLLPVSVGLPSRETVTAAPSEAVAEAVEELESAGPEEVRREVSTIWLPALRSAYATRIALAEAPSDGPHALTLRRLVADLDD